LQAFALYHASNGWLGDWQKALLHKEWVQMQDDGQKLRDGLSRIKACQWQWALSWG
jgi:hypothetical protein